MSSRAKASGSVEGFIFITFSFCWDRRRREPPVCRSLRGLGAASIITKEEEVSLALLGFPFVVHRGLPSLRSGVPLKILLLFYSLSPR
jgi:hypothetical protein